MDVVVVVVVVDVCGSFKITVGGEAHAFGHDEVTVGNRYW